MIGFKPDVPFAFDYPTFDQMSGLFVRASIYEVTTGSPVLVTTVPMSEVQDGFYVGNFSGLSGKSYLVISLVYTDGTFSTIDINRPPNADCYKSNDAPITFACFNYGVYDQNAGLFIASDIFNITSGTPVFEEQIGMDHVLGGVYFCSFTGAVDQSYVNMKFIYLDSGFTTVDPTFAPGQDIFVLYGAEIAFISESAKLKGQSSRAILKERIQ